MIGSASGRPITFLLVGRWILSYGVARGTSSFSTKSAYESLTDQNSQNKDPLLLFGPGPCPWWSECTLWMLYHGKLLTNMYRGFCGLAHTKRGPRCSSAPESIFHAFRDCDFSKSICKKKIIQESQWDKFFSLDLRRWLKFNLNT